MPPNKISENWPLYDIMNQFQKGQSHMAIVLKCDATAATDAEGLDSSFDPGDYLSNSTDASNRHSQETEYYSATTKNTMEQEGGSDPPQKTSEQLDTNTSFENFESLPRNLDEEVIGIITLEDVMEELLQHQNQPATSKTSVVRILQKGFNFSSILVEFRVQIYQDSLSLTLSWVQRLSFCTPTYISPISPPRRS